jgi:hypothetical protein
LNHWERRKRPRLPLEVLARIKVGGEDRDLAETRDVSARGIYMHTHTLLRRGQELECELVLPEVLTRAPAPMLVLCHGKVVRVNKRRLGQKLGAAIEIYSYDFSWPRKPPERL